MVEKDLNHLKYQVVGEINNQKIKQLYWNMAVGLNQVDGLKPSDYMKSLISDHVHGKLEYHEVTSLLDKYYQKIETRKFVNEDEKECDKVACRIYQMICDPSFSYTPTYLKVIHKELFQDIYDFAGEFKHENYLKYEPTLNDLDTVKYGDYREVEHALKSCFDEAKLTKNKRFDADGLIDYITELTSAIWTIHPFAEGNTRTTAVFIAKYLNTMGFAITNDLFKDHSAYFRCALVKANYRLINKGFFGDDTCLKKFFENLLYDRKHRLDIRDTVVEETFMLPNGTVEIDYSKIFESSLLK